MAYFANYFLQQISFGLMTKLIGQQVVWGSYKIRGSVFYRDKIIARDGRAVLSPKVSVRLIWAYIPHYGQKSFQK